MALVSVGMPVRQKDPHRRSGPFDTGDDPTTAGAAVGQQYLMLLLAALTAVPAGVLVLVGVLQDRPVLQAAGVLVPVAFNLFGVDPEVRVWFAARYLPQERQLLAAAGFVAAGLLAIWWAETIRRRHAAEAGG
jgi:hypothetical protein